MLTGFGLYIHFPWCIQKCPYCDFNSHAVKHEVPEQAYIDALLGDLRCDLTQLSGRPVVTSVFMGGGTPSLFSPQAIERLLAGIQKQVELSADCEITLEANPGTFEAAKFQAYRQLGVNRLSIGVQSFNDRHLQVLGRVHNAAEAMRAAEIAVRAGFDNFNLDLMFGLPEQSIEQMQQDIECAISLKPTHLSFYQLTLEPNTYFHKFPPRLPDDDLIYLGQKWCQQILVERGYRQYEVSAYAQDDYVCRHNRNYWRFGDYLGIGAGAHGKLSLKLPDKLVRTQKVKRPEQYLQGDKIKSQELIEIPQLPLEFVMNQLRLREGFDLAHYSTVTGLSEQSLQPALTESIAEGLLVEHGTRIVCTERGWDFLDHILEKFMP